MPRRPARLLSFGSTLLLAACAGKDAPSLSTTIDSAGVIIVTGPAADVPIPWTLTEVRRLGGADSGALAFTDASEHTVATDGRNRIVVFDRDAGNRIRVFDSLGTLVRSFGGKGSGPGETQWANGMTVDRDGSVTVFDIEKQALVQWGPDGEVRPETKVPNGRGYPWGGVTVRGETTYVLMQVTDSVHSHFALERRTPRDTVALDSLLGPKAKMTMFKCVGLTLAPLFTGRMWWGLGDGVVAISVQDGYRIDLREGTTLRRSVRRAIAPPATTQGDADRLYPDGFKVMFGGGECVTPTTEVVEKVGMAPTRPLTAAVRFGPDGTLWVERFTFKGDAPSVDVFDRTGGYLGTLAGKGLPIGFLGDELVLFPIEDEATGTKVVGIYRIAPVRG